MKRIVNNLVCGFALLGAALSTSAQSTVNYTLTDAGNSETRVSWNITGDFVGSGMEWTTVNNTWGMYGITGRFGNYLNGSPFSSPANFYPVVGAGTFSDPTGGNTVAPNTTAALAGVTFVNVSGITLLGVVFSSDFPFVPQIGLNNGDRVTYTPGTDSGIIAVPFSDFIPGTYQFILPAGPSINGGGWATTLTENLTIGVVPEPSTLTLVGLGVSALIVARRRKQ